MSKRRGLETECTKRAKTDTERRAKRVQRTQQPQLGGSPHQVGSPQLGGLPHQGGSPHLDGFLLTRVVHYCAEKDARDRLALVHRLSLVCRDWGQWAAHSNRQLWRWVTASQAAELRHCGPRGLLSFLRRRISSEEHGKLRHRKLCEFYSENLRVAVLSCTAFYMLSRELHYHSREAIDVLGPFAPHLIPHQDLIEQLLPLWVEEEALRVTFVCAFKPRSHRQFTLGFCPNFYLLISHLCDRERIESAWQTLQISERQRTDWQSLIDNRATFEMTANCTHKVGFMTVSFARYARNQPIFAWANADYFQRPRIKELWRIKELSAKELRHFELDARLRAHAKHFYALYRLCGVPLNRALFTVEDWGRAIIEWSIDLEHYDSKLQDAVLSTLSRCSHVNVNETTLGELLETFPYLRHRLSIELDDSQFALLSSEADTYCTKVAQRIGIV